MTKKSSMKTSNNWDNSTKNTVNDSRMSVQKAQAAFKDIVKSKAKNNKKLFKMLKEKKQSIMPPAEAAQVRVSEPLPFTFSPRNSGGKMNLQSLDFSK